MEKLNTSLKTILTQHQKHYLLMAKKLTLNLDNLQRKYPQNTRYIENYLDQFFRFDANTSMELYYKKVSDFKNELQQITHSLSMHYLSLSNPPYLQQSLDYLTWYLDKINNKTVKPLFDSENEHPILFLNSSCSLTTKDTPILKNTNSQTTSAQNHDFLTKTNSSIEPSHIFKIYQLLDNQDQKRSFLQSLDGLFKEDARLYRIFLKCPEAFNLICHSKLKSQHPPFLKQALLWLSNNINRSLRGLFSRTGHFLIKLAQ